MEGTSFQLESFRLPGWFWEHDKNDASGFLTDPDGEHYGIYDMQPYEQQGWIEYKMYSDSRYNIFYDNNLENFHKFVEEQLLEEIL